MAIISRVFTGQSLAEATEAFNDFMSASPMVAYNVTGFNVVVREMIGQGELEIAISCLFDTSGVGDLSDPFVAVPVSANSTENLQADISEVLSDIPTATVVAGPFTDFLGARRRLDNWIAIIVYSLSPDAPDKWLV